MSLCRSCGQQIVWAFTEPGRRMPVDAGPHPDGTITLRTVAGEMFAVIDPGEPGPKHRSHFASCPQADKWRRR